jgi:hypothetical protein
MELVRQANTMGIKSKNCLGFRVNGCVCVCVCVGSYNTMQWDCVMQVPNDIFCKFM